eukprot:10082-Heterococcus_DN1.PRE.2
MRATHTVVIVDGEQYSYAYLTALLACVFIGDVLLSRAQATATTAAAASAAATAVATATTTATAPTIAY